MLSELIIVGLLLANCVLSSVCQIDVTLDALCNDRVAELHSISQVRRLISDSSLTNLALCDPFKNSLNELDEILAIVESGKTCNLDLVDKIRKYQSKHISRVDDHDNKDTIPYALRQFFIALGFQLSAECKILMINNFENDLKGRITEEDYDTFPLLEKAGATFLDDDTEITDFDDVVLINDLKILSSPSSAQVDKLLIKVQTSEIFNKLKRTCRNKFKPFYDKLIMPLVGLSNLGYNYKGEMLERELAELRANTLIRRWYKIVQTCESFEAVEIFEDADMSLDGKQAITLISRDEANTLRSNEQIDSDKPLEYEPAPSHNSDKLWILEKQEIEQLISKYQSNTSEASRIRSRLMKKLFSRVKEALKRNKIVVRTTERNGQDLSPTKVMSDIVSMMDDVVGSESEVSSLDSPVAGGRKRVGRIPPPSAPPRVSHIPKKMIGTRMRSWLWDSTIGGVIPSRCTVILWLLTFSGIIMILMFVIASG